MKTITDNVLSPQHIEDLRKSGLTSETISKYDFASIRPEEASQMLGFTAPSGGWRIIYPRSTFLKFKPDKPFTAKMKYLSPKDTAQELFITHLASEMHDDLSQPYYFCEGEKKCLALEQTGYAAIGVSGVWNWKSRGHTIEGLSQINLSGRECYIVFDSDKYFNDHVKKAEGQFAETLASLGAKVRIVNLDPSFGKGADDQLLRLPLSDFQYYIDKAQDYAPDLKYEIPQLPPVSLPQFLAKDIPSVEYYVTSLLMKQGKTMISAQANIGKSIFVQNLSMAMALGKTKFLNKFDVTQAKVLYLDLEMGESALMQRFRVFCKDEPEGVNDLFIKYIPDADFLDKEFQAALENWLTTLGINVLIIDPLSNAWSGDENDKQQVQILTTYLNTLIAKHKISIVVVHHWRKGTKDFKTGGEMAAGSYKWSAWLDFHVTLSGAPESITINCEKSRHIMRFKSFLAKINTDTLQFEYITDFEKKFTQDTLAKLFNDLGAERVAIPDLIKHAKEKKSGSEKTIRSLIAGSTTFEIDKTDKTHYLVRKQELLDENDFIQS
jgi:hypothetical protein